MAILKGVRLRERTKRTFDVLVAKEKTMSLVNGAWQTTFSGQTVRPASYTADSRIAVERTWDELHPGWRDAKIGKKPMKLRPKLRKPPPKKKKAKKPSVPKDRSTPKLFGPDVTFYRHGGAPYADRPKSVTKRKRSSKRSQKTRKYRSRVRKLLTERTGGLFLNVKSNNPWFDLQGQGKTVYTSGTLRWEYDGGFVPSSFGTHQMSSADMANIGQTGVFGPLAFADAYPYGATGYNKARPKIETADGATFLGEFAQEGVNFLKSTLKDFHDSWKVIRRRPDAPHLGTNRIANAWLNHHFGWAPFVSDLRKFYATYQNSDEYIRQRVRDNGQWIKRYREVEKGETRSPIETTTGTSPNVWGSPNGFVLKFRTIGGVNRWGITNHYMEEKYRVWFEGVFRYYVPLFEQDNSGSVKCGAGHAKYRDKYHEAMRYAQLYGLRVNPSTLWNLMPWSWLVDWVSNAGDVISNMAAAGEDQLTTRYAFIMKHVKRRIINDSTIFMSDGDRHCFWYQEIETKHRVTANPYGFNLSWADFSPKQLSILAALGITRAHGRN